MELTGIAWEAKCSTVLVSKVFAPAANRLGTVQRNIVVSLALAPSHSARQLNGALLWNCFKVSFMLFIPFKNRNTNTIWILSNITIYCLLNAYIIILILFLSFVIHINNVKVTTPTFSISISFGRSVVFTFSDFNLWLLK